MRNYLASASPLPIGPRMPAAGSPHRTDHDESRIPAAIDPKGRLRLAALLEAVFAARHAEREQQRGHGVSTMDMAHVRRETSASWRTTPQPWSGWPGQSPACSTNRSSCTRHC